MTASKAHEYLQQQVCARYGSPFHPSPESTTIALPPNISDRVHPINGLRVAPHGEHNGWFIWLGDVLSQEPDYFNVQHVAHLNDLKPDILPFLGLDVGWRFLLAPGHVDVWYDASLLHSRDALTVQW